MSRHLVFSGDGRMTLLVAAIAATLITFGATGWAMVRAQIVEDAATRDMIEVTELLNDLNDSGSAAFNGMVLATNEPGAADLAWVDMNRARATEFMLKLGVHASKDREQAALFQAAETMRQAYLVHEDRLFAMLLAGDSESARQFMAGEPYQRASLAVGPAFQAFIVGMQDGTRAAYERSRRAAMRAMMFGAGGVLVIAILWGTILVDWVRQTREAHKQTEAAREAQARLADMNDELERRVLLRTHELERARDAAESANKAKSEFLAAMSHELRTPLNGVLGMATVMERTPLTDPQKSMLQVIESSGRSLLTLLNDVLDFARLEAGQMNLRQEPFELAEVLERAAAPHRAEAERKGLELRIAMTSEARGVFVGDEMRICQIVGNLLSNAVKFTERGHVEIDAHYRGGMLRIAVTDTGCGVDPARMERLFERFSQGDNSLRRRHGGLGLGLALARELTVAQGGEIGVNPTRRNGAEFWFELPVPRWTPAASGDASVRAA